MKDIEVKTINHDNLKWLYSVLDTNEEVQEVSNYLNSNNLVIEIKDGFYDVQSGWTGQHVYLEGRNLSGNGYCFSGKSLLNHVRGYRKFLDISKTEEYKLYQGLKKKYADVERDFQS